MPIIARDNQKSFAPAPAGLHQAVCVDIVDLGTQSTPWGDKPKVDIRWQIEAIDEESGKRFQVFKRYTLSLNEKATLRQHLEAWRGRKFTPEELQGFDLEKLIGVNCQVQVVHAEGDQGRVFANIQAIVPIGKGMDKIAAEDYVRAKDRANGHAAAVPADDDVPF